MDLDAAAMPVLQPGARICVVAPASAPREPDRYTEGCAALQRDWTVAMTYDEATVPHGYLSMPDAERAAQLQHALTAPGIQAVLCARGGYGTMRLLPHLDWEALARATPRWIVGYSDITALQLACWMRLRWPSLSGPVVTEWGQLSSTMRTDVFRATGPGTYVPTWPKASAPEVWVPGAATGVLIGGTLSVLTRLLGTPYMPDLTDAVLLLEDVQEPPYAIDRMLMHLELAGVLERLAGVLLGKFSVPPNVQEPTLSMNTVLRDYFAERPYPVCAHVPYGHLLPRTVWPLGVPVQMRLHNEQVSVTCTPTGAPE